MNETMDHEDDSKAWIQDVVSGRWYEIDVPGMFGIERDDYALWMQNAEKAAVLDLTVDDDRERFAQLDIEIEHDDAATRLGYVLRSLRSDHKRAIAPFENEINRLTAQLKELNRKHEVQAGFIERQLTNWHRYQMSQDISRTTIKLPSVTLKSTKERAKALLRGVVFTDQVEPGMEAVTRLGDDEVVGTTGQASFEQFVKTRFGDAYPSWVRHKETWELSKNDVMKLLKDKEILIDGSKVFWVDEETGEKVELPFLTITQPTDLDRAYKAVT